MPYPMMIVLVVALGIIGLACGPSATATPSTTPTATVVPSPTPVSTATPTPRPASNLTLEELPALLPSAREVSEILGVDLSKQAMPDDLGQEFEHVDLAAHGLLAGHWALYTQPEEELEVGGYVSVALFKTPEGARGAFKDLSEELRQDIGAEPTTFEVEAVTEAGADEALGIVFATSPDNPFVTTMMVLRRDNAVVSIWVLGNEEMRQEVVALARKVIAKIEDKA